jgi:hypothetical protein
MSRAKDTLADDGTPPHVALASAALLEGWTRQQVIAALVSRIRRDGGYRAYRQATGRRTGYDEQVKAAMRARVDVLLGEDGHHDGVESAARREGQRTDWP